MTPGGVRIALIAVPSDSESVQRIGKDMRAIKLA